MERYSRIMLIYSFASFIMVLVFGMTAGAAKELLTDAEAMENFKLFHSHFDQLCWLGAAALGLIFHYFKDTYRGSKNMIRLFAYSYITGTLIFSFAFLTRTVGFAVDSRALQKEIFIGMVSLSGFFFIVLLACGLYILSRLITARHTA